MRPQAAPRLGAVFVALLLWTAGCALAWAQDVLPLPPLSGRVIDQTGTLSEAQTKALTEQLAAVETRHGSQVVVLIVATTQPEDIAAYAQRVGDSWKIGRREVGDGLLVVVAKNDRTVRIEVAKALEGAVTDLGAKTIIDEQIVPAFRAGRFAGGLTSAVATIDRLIAHEQLPTPPPRADDQQGPSRYSLAVLAGMLALVLTLAAWIYLSSRPVRVRATSRRPPQSWRTAANATSSGSVHHESCEPSWSSGRDSSDSSSSRSDSFSSSGGGDFGGGGASGKW